VVRPSGHGQGDGVDLGAAEAGSGQIDRGRPGQSATKDSSQAFEKLTTIVDGQPRIVSDPPLIVPVHELLPDADASEVIAQLEGLLQAYRRTLPSDRSHLLEQYRLVDMARKVVGVGSVGTRAWILLMEGIDSGDPMFLQAKEAQASVLEEFAGRVCTPTTANGSSRASTSCRRW